MIINILSYGAEFALRVVRRSQLFFPVVSFAGLLIVLVILFTDVLGLPSLFWAGKLFPGWDGSAKIDQDDIFGWFIKTSFFFGLILELLSLFPYKRTQILENNFSLLSRIKGLLIITSVLFMITATLIFFTDLVPGNSYLAMILTIALFYLVAIVSTAWYMFVKYFLEKIEKVLRSVRR